MNVSSKRPTRANAIPRANRSLIGAAIAVAMAAAAPASAALPPSQAPCDGAANTCYHNGLYYTDNSWVTGRVTEFADGSGSAVADFNYYDTEAKIWTLTDAGSQMLYWYVDGYDENGYPITQRQYAYAPASVAIEDFKTLDIGSVMAAGSGGRISNLADGVAPMDAVNKRQLDWVAANAGGNDPLAVKYTDGNRNIIKVGGWVGDLADGQADSDAANMGQVRGVLGVANDGVNRANNAQARADSAFNNAATAQTTANTANTAVTNLSKVALTYTDATKAAVNVNAQVRGVTAGTAATDAVNVNQLNGVRNVAQDGVNRAVNAQARADSAFNNAATAQARADKG
ncbi:hypothetical protein EOD15_33285, partial [Mesorhizobium sp. M7A.T.Ca.US.000.02.2.1]